MEWITLTLIDGGEVTVRVSSITSLMPFIDHRATEATEVGIGAGWYRVKKPYGEMKKIIGIVAEVAT